MPKEYGTSLAWRGWNLYAATGISSSRSNSATTGTNYIIQETWANWINTYIRTSTNSITSSTCWDNWIQGAWVKPAPPTKEQLAERQIQQERARIEAQALLATRGAAKKRAEKLLFESLNLKQREDLKKHGYFHAFSRSGKKYRIYQGSHGNVKLLDAKNREVESLCIQPMDVPEEDSMLAQKLWIETNEDMFRDIANKRPLVTN